MREIRDAIGRGRGPGPAGCIDENPAPAAQYGAISIPATNLHVG